MASLLCGVDIAKDDFFNIFWFDTGNTLEGGYMLDLDIFGMWNAQTDI